MGYVPATYGRSLFNSVISILLIRRVQGTMSRMSATRRCIILRSSRPVSKQSYHLTRTLTIHLRSVPGCQPKPSKSVHIILFINSLLTPYASGLPLLRLHWSKLISASAMRRLPHSKRRNSMLLVSEALYRYGHGRPGVLVVPVILF